MQKDNDSILTIRNKAILAIAIIAIAFSVPAYCQIDGTALLLQQSPADGGIITPDTGVHQFTSNSEITLTAVPRPGYQFVYWLGDVTNPSANSTTVYLDSPKIVIAVFEQAKYEFLAISEEPQSTPGGGGDLQASPADYSNQGYTGGGAKRPHKIRWPSPYEQPDDDDDDDDDDDESDFLVPRDDDDILVPVPEPATVVLLALGGLTLMRKRQKK